MTLPARLRSSAAARLIERVRRLARPEEVPQARLRKFLRESARRPRISLSGEAPGSVAVVVPCFSHAAYLSDMFDSIVAQSRLPDEVIFVDDCSPDSTGEILRSLVAIHRETAGRRFEVVVNERNMGQAGSLNRGISMATSDLILILNDDDYLMHDAVESMLALFAQHRDVALIGAHSSISRATSRWRPNRS